MPEDDPQPRIYVAGCVTDATGMNCAPGAVAVARGRILAAGEVEQVVEAAGSEAQRVDLPDRLLVPGLVNAHVHLELTGVGYQPYDGDFTAWLRRIRSHFPDPTDPLSEANARHFAESARAGAELSRAAGVTTVGDISRFESVRQAVAAAGVRGVSFCELFGVGEPFDEPALRQLHELAEGNRRIGDLAVGAQPHAPYSAGRRLYGAAAESGLPVATHLAESGDELKFVATGGGRFRELLESIGKWHDTFAEDYCHGLTPVQWMKPDLERTPWLLAHCNYVTDEDIELLAGTGASVAYCPRASEYFGHRLHRYMELLEAGVNVCLGTDSIVCHGTLSIVDEMRRLHRRDKADPRTLLAMATTHGAAALGLDGMDARLAPGSPARMAAIGYDPADATDALEQVLRSRTPADITLIDPLAEATP